MWEELEPGEGVAVCLKNGDCIAECRRSGDFLYWEFLRRRGDGSLEPVGQWSSGRAGIGPGLTEIRVALEIGGLFLRQTEDRARVGP